MRVQAAASPTTALVRRKCHALSQKIGLNRMTGRFCAFSPFLVAMLGIQGIWILFDSNVTSQRRHKPKRPPMKVTQTSPLSPFYTTVSGQPLPFDGPALAFPIFPGPYPCGPLMDAAPQSLSTRTVATEGLLYIKEMETGSTILAGVTARIARRRAMEQPWYDASSLSNSTASSSLMCTARLMPIRARKLAERNRHASFLWSFVREPVDRLVHKYYHYATHRRGWAKVKSGKMKAPPSTPAEIAKDMIYYILNMENADYGYYLKSLSLSWGINTYRTDLYKKYTKDILESYDFLGVVERWDESLAVLQLLLGLETRDMLYLPTPRATKKSGGGGGGEKDDNDSLYSSDTDYYEHWNKQCRPIPATKVYLDMKQWFYSEEFEAFTEADVLVYRAVNRSLDLTIKSLGAEKVDRAVRQLQWANARAQELCTNVRYPCSSDGQTQQENDCLLPDVGIGCGYSCLDEVGASLSKNEDFQALPR